MTCLLADLPHAGPGRSPVAVASHRLWQHRFAGDERLLGDTISLNGVPFTVIGIAPKSARRLRSGAPRRRSRHAADGGVARVALVVRDALGLVGTGLLVGLAGSLAAGHGLERYLYRVSPTDPRALGGALVALALVAVMAAWWPARRATRVDP